jgi:hypothetical protein
MSQGKDTLLHELMEELKYFVKFQDQKFDKLISFQFQQHQMLVLKLT